MISLQVSANRAQSASDKRAIADHETLIALHEMGKQQLDILNGQNQVLSILDNFASKDMPGRAGRNPAGVQQDPYRGGRARQRRADRLGRARRAGPVAPENSAMRGPVTSLGVLARKNGS